MLEQLSLNLTKVVSAHTTRKLLALLRPALVFCIAGIMWIRRSVLSGSFKRL